MTPVAELNKESTLNRVLRENALAALLVVLTLVAMVNGVILGLSIATISSQSEKMETLQRAYEMNAAWQGRLIGYVEKAGIEVPPQPIEE